MMIDEKPELNFDVDKMDLNQLRDITKMLIRLMNFEHDRVTHLQDRVLILEMNKSGDNI